MRGIRIPIRWALKRIEQADADETEDIMSSLFHCYRRLHPKCELVVMTLPKYSTEARYAAIAEIAACLKKEYIKEYAER